MRDRALTLEQVDVHIQHKRGESGEIGDARQADHAPRKVTEVRRRLLGRDDRDIGGQRRVERLGDTVDLRPAVCIDARDVRISVDAGVGPPGDRQLAPGREDRVEPLP